MIKKTILSIIMLIGLVSYFFSEHDPNVVMACGIFGIISADRNKKRKFNTALFNVLGIHNDTRGGDSCGIFIDGQSEYGVDKEKYYADFFQKSKLLNETKEASIALGHCRKASAGMKKTIKEAQPVILHHAKTGEVRFVMIHNGTIKNYKELAKKYLPDLKIEDDWTDTQVMARIFYYKGYDCLAEYEGGSVFFIVDYRQPEPRVLMFKGASKEYSYSTKITDERPFNISLGKSDFVFSSLDDYLPAFRPNIEVQTIKENALIEYRNGDLWIVEEYDRSKMVQKPTTTTYYSGGGYYSGSYGGVKTAGSGSTNFSSGSSNSSLKTRSMINHDEKTNLYRAEGNLVHGVVWANEYGWASPSFSSGEKEIWFFYGVPLKKKECFKLLEDYLKKSKQKPDEFIKKHINLIRYLSLDCLYFKNDVLVKATNIYNYSVYSGPYKGLFGSYEYTYDMGQYKTKVFITYDKDKFKLFSAKDVFDLGRLRKKLSC